MSVEGRSFVTPTFPAVLFSDTDYINYSFVSTPRNGEIEISFLQSRLGRTGSEQIHFLLNGFLPESVNQQIPCTVAP